MLTDICTKANQQCVDTGCRHASPHGWTVQCASTTCTHFSELVCKECEDLKTCGTTLIFNPDTGEMNRKLDVNNPLRLHSKPFLSCMNCPKFADAAIRDRECKGVDTNNNKNY